MTRDEMIVRSYSYQRETGCGEQERAAFYDGLLEANDLLSKKQDFSLADLLAIKPIFEEILETLRSQRDYYRGRDMIKYEEKHLKYENHPYNEKLEKVNNMINEIVEKI